MEAKTTIVNTAAPNPNLLTFIITSPRLLKGKENYLPCRNRFSNHSDR